VDHRHRPVVRDQPERVSAFSRNRCPGSSGIGVRDRPDYAVDVPLTSFTGSFGPHAGRVSERTEVDTSDEMADVSHLAATRCMIVG